MAPPNPRLWPLRKYKHVPRALALSPEDSFPDILAEVGRAVQPPLFHALGIPAAVFVSVPFELRKQRKETVLKHFQLTSLDASLSL